MEDYVNAALLVFDFCARSNLNTQDFFSHWLTRFIYDELDEKDKEDFKSLDDYSDLSYDFIRLKNSRPETFCRNFSRLYSKALEIVIEADYNIDDPSIERNIMELKISNYSIDDSPIEKNIMELNKS